MVTTTATAVTATVLRGRPACMYASSRPFSKFPPSTSVANRPCLSIKTQRRTEWSDFCLRKTAREEESAATGAEPAFGDQPSRLIEYCNGRAVVYKAFPCT